MGWNLGSRFTIGHSRLVGQCAASFLVTWSQRSAGKTNTRNSFNAFRWEQRKRRCWVYSWGSADEPCCLAPNKHCCWYRAALLWCTYNNIALWRSPERTGKCRLCASEGGGVGPRMCLYSPNNSPCWALVRGGGKGWCDISKGLLYTCMLHLWVNKVWKSAERGVTAPRVITGGMWHMEGELQLRGAGEDECMHVRKMDPL